MARDNEARRIEEIGYATGTAPSNLIIDSKEKLANTWMCAETSIVKIPVSDAEDSIVPVVRGINLGLVKRPQAVLTLDKHITSLKIGDIINATADIHKYKDEAGKVNLKSDTGTESIFLATATDKAANSRGEWIIETDVPSLGGKRLDIIYSYIISNIGDADYMGEGLNSALNGGISYTNIAQAVKQEKSKPGYISGKYLGTAYYNGNTSGNVPVAMPVKVEDYLGKTTNELQLAEGDFKVQGNETKNVWAKSGENATEEVTKIQTESRDLVAGSQYVFTANAYNPNLNTSTGKDFTFRSYVAQLVSVDGKATSKTGTLPKGAALGNLDKVQSYAPAYVVEPNELMPEADEFVAETVTITMDTGGDKQTPVLLITAITGGLTLIAVGIVLIKKFVIK